MTLSLIELARLGRELLSEDKIEEAQNIFREMTRLYPNEGVGYANLGQAYFECNNAQDAIVNYEKALALDSRKFAPLLNRLHLLYRMFMDYDNADRIALALDKSREEEPLISLSKDEDPMKNFTIAQIRSEKIVKSVSYLYLYNKNKSRKRKIKIGYISYDFRTHPMAQLIAGVLKHHDKRKFEVFVFSTGPNDNSIWRHTIESSVNNFFDLSSYNDNQLARFIREQEIDILIDLNGHTSGSRQFAIAQKPAPIIVNYLGFPGSTGSTYHNFIVADKTVIKKDEEKYFSEQVMYMPYTYYPTNNSWPKITNPYTRESMLLPSEKFIFGCFVQPLRITRKDFVNFMKILLKVPNSILWMIKQSEQTVIFARKMAQDMKVDPKRIFFTREMMKFDHLRRIPIVDLLLDTSIYGGHTTTVDALWAGVPVLTIYGKHFSSRVATSILKAIQLEELSTKDTKQYIQKAVFLAKHPQELKSIAEKLKINIRRTPLFDTKEYTRNLEKLYWKMYASKSSK